MSNRAARERQLLEERDRTAKLLAELTSDFDSVVEAAMEVSLDDEHDPEGAGIAYERSQVDAVLHMMRERLAGIEAALSRLHDGQDGVCSECGSEIPLERLAAQPATTRCVRCAAPARRTLKRIR